MHAVCMTRATASLTDRTLGFESTHSLSPMHDVGPVGGRRTTTAGGLSEEDQTRTSALH